MTAPAAFSFHRLLPAAASFEFKLVCDNAHTHCPPPPPPPASGSQSWRSRKQIALNLSLPQDSAPQKPQHEQQESRQQKSQQEQEQSSHVPNSPLCRWDSCYSTKSKRDTLTPPQAPWNPLLTKTKRKRPKQPKKTRPPSPPIRTTLDIIDLALAEAADTTF